MSTLEDSIKRRTGSDKLIGCFVIDGNGRGILKDIRGLDGEPEVVNGYNLNDAVIPVGNTSFVPGEFYVFEWHIKDGKDVAITISGDIHPVDKSALLDRLFNVYAKKRGKDLHDSINFQNTIFTEVTGADHTYIYELLQNANDYPYIGEKDDVRVRFEVTQHYLLFLHTGAEFNLRNIVGICSINQGEKKKNAETIGYKGIGFKTVFVNNDYVYLHSGEWGLRFDRKYSEEKCMGECAWSLMPIPTDENQLDDELRKALEKVSAKYRVQFAMRHKSDASKNIPLLKKVFDNQQILLFIPHVSEVQVYYNGKEQYDIKKDKDKWVVSRFPFDIPSELKKWVKNNIDSGGSRIPEKFRDIDTVGISFAVGRNGKELIPIENARVYNYLPTELDLGFHFLINADFIPNGSRSGLHDTHWNDEIMRQCGRQFVDWWRGFLINEGELDMNSVFSLLPDMSSRDRYAKLFMEGFSERILEVECIPVVADGDYKLAKIEDLIFDEVGATDPDVSVISDDEFYQITGTAKLLPHKLIRNNPQLRSLLLEDFVYKVEIFDVMSLRHLCAKTSFASWLKVPENDVKFLTYVIEKIFINDIIHERIFVTQSGELSRKEDIYHDVDNYLTDIDFLSDYIPRLNTKVKDRLKVLKGWGNIREQFKHFSDFDFARDIIEHHYNNIEKLLLDIRNNTRFVHFLSKSGYQINLRRLSFPIFDRKGSIHRSYSKAVYLSSKLGEDILEQPWADKNWYVFPSNEYFIADSWDVYNYLQSAGLKVMNAQSFLDDIMSTDEAINYISSKIKSIDVNVSFYKFMAFNFSDSKISDRRKTDKMRNSFCLIATDGYETSLVPASTVVYLRNEDWAIAASQQWMPKQALLGLSGDYYKDLTVDEKKQFDFYISNKKGIVQSFTWRSLGNNFQNNKILPSIISGINDKDKSHDFLDFLFTYRKDLFKGESPNENFLNIPIKIDGDSTLSSVNKSKADIYYHSEDLDGLLKEDWFSIKSLSIADSSYNDLFDGSDRKIFYRNLGFKSFDTIGFIKGLLDTDIEGLSSIIKERNKNLSFYKFIFSIRKKLNQEDFDKIKKLPIYIESSKDDNGELSDHCEDHYLPSATLSRVINLDIIPDNILDSIHPDYVSTEEERKYYADSLGNVELDGEQLVNYISQDANVDKVTDYLQDTDRNIRFWRWVYDSGLNSEERSKLKVFPVLSKDNDELVSPEGVFLSNSYSDGNNLEEYIKAYTTNPVFVSPRYFREGDDKKTWVRIFKSLDMSVDQHDLVFNFILPNLASYRQLDTVGILSDFEEEFNNCLQGAGKNEIKKQLQSIQLLCNDGEYRQPSEALLSGAYVRVYANPFPDVVIPHLISEDYLTKAASNDRKARVRRLVTGIMDSLDRTLTLTSLRELKINYYLGNQGNFSKDAHMRVISEIVSLYKSDRDGITEFLNGKDVYLYDKSGLLCPSQELTLGSRYMPDCDFEGNGIETLRYISEDYASLTTDFWQRHSFFNLLLNVRDSFDGSCMKLLTNYEFARYFWKGYVPRHKSDYTIKPLFLDGKQAITYCIPTSEGVKRPVDVYDYRIPQILRIVRKLPKGSAKLPNVEIPEWLEHVGMRNRLSIPDCLEYLKLNDLDYRRELIYRWIVENKDENLYRYRNLIGEYISSAQWYTGAKTWADLSGLVAIEWGNMTLKGNFGNSQYICNPSNMPEYKQDFERLCKIFGITILTNDDFKKRKNGEWHLDNTAKTEMRKRLLYLSYKRGTKDWQSEYEEKARQLDMCDICSCQSIDYYYNDNISTELMSYTEENDKLWYKGAWDGKMFLNVITWFKRVFGFSDFEDSYMEKLFDEDFKTFLNNSEVDFPQEFLALLDDTTREGLREDNEAATTEDDSSEYWQSLSSNDASPEDSSFDNSETESQDDNSSQVINGNASIGTENEENAEVQDDNTSRQRKERSDKGHRHQTSNKNNVTNNQSDDEGGQETGSSEIQQDLEKRLRQKWEERMDRSIGKPHSSSTNPSKVGDNYSDVYGSDYYPQSENYDYSKDNNSDDMGGNSNNDFSTITQKALANKLKETKEAEAKAQDERDIFGFLSSTPKYTFLWFKYLMELMYADKYGVNKKTADIDFRNYDFVSNDTIMRVSNPNRAVPTWILDGDHISVYSLSKGGKHILKDIKAIHCDAVSIDFTIPESEDFSKNMGDSSIIRIHAEDNSNFVDALMTRFTQLNLPDGYNMKDNLPKDISFIYGPPGTGKTTRIKDIVHDIIKDNEKINILILTPTNKAADVIAEKLVDDDITFQYLTRFGTTDNVHLVEEGIIGTRDSMNIDDWEKNIVVTTAARYPYDIMQPDDTSLCDIPWDYIIIDEASMMDLVSITYILFKGEGAKFIIAGDPMQIRPVREGNIDVENIYQMLGIEELKTAINGFKKYPLQALTTQFRAIPQIGNFISNFAYNGLVRTDPKRTRQKPLVLDGLKFKAINMLGFEVHDFDQLYGLGMVGGSALHLYSAIFTYNLASYMAEQLKKHIPNGDYTIGIDCPYKAEADAIKQMIEARPIGNDVCKIYCGTAHSFQGDECDIMFVVLNPPAKVGNMSHINDINIVNVAMSRARDYLFILMPQGQMDGYNVKKRIYKSLKNEDNKSIQLCRNIEKVIFGNEHYIEENTEVTCHLPVNVYYNSYSEYDVRWDDSALDIQIHDK